MAADGLTYIPAFLDCDAQAVLLEHLMALPYHHDVFRGRPLKRSYAQFGYAYRSTGRRLESAAPFPDFLLQLIEKAMPFSLRDEPVNQCIVAHYPPGAGIGWHRDAPSFGNCIMGVSLEGPARLQFRADGAESVAYELGVDPGSLYTMQGPARWEHQHRIVPVRTGRRSLTLRHVH